MTSGNVQPFEAVPTWDHSVEIRRKTRLHLGAVIDATEARLRLACKPETLEYIVQRRGLKSIVRSGKQYCFRTDELNRSICFFRVLLDRCV